MYLSVLISSDSCYDQDMVLVYHEIQVESRDGKHRECRKATLLEFGRMGNGKSTSAMALSVGIPVAIGALVNHLYIAVPY